MNSDKKDRKKDLFDRNRRIDELNKFFIEIQKMMEESFKDMLKSDIKPGKSYVRGFNVHIEPNGKPKIEEFGNHQEKDTNGDTFLSEEREPLVDIIENKKNVSITVELPGVEKEDIDIDVKNQQLEINVLHPNRKYHKIIDLPCNVKPKTTNATYKNGVLDIEIEKKKKNSEERGYRIDID